MQIYSYLIDIGIMNKKMFNLFLRNCQIEVIILCAKEKKIILKNKIHKKMHNR